MTMTFYYSYLVLLIICFVTGLICTWRLKWAFSPAKLLPWFLVLTFISEMIALQWAIKYHTNHIIYNVYQVLQFIFYSFTLYRVIKNDRLRKLLLFISIGFPVSAVINLFFVQNVHQFNAINFYGGAIILSFFSGYALSEFFRITAIDSPFKMPHFWITGSILVLNSCLIPLELPFALSLRLTPGEVGIVIGLIAVVNFIAYSMFTVGFIHLYKNNKASTR